MAKAVFIKPFNFTPKGKGVSFKIEPGDKPQEFPEYVIAAARKAGAVATEKPPAK